VKENKKKKVASVPKAHKQSKNREKIRGYTHPYTNSTSFSLKPNGIKVWSWFCQKYSLLQRDTN